MSLRTLRNEFKIKDPTSPIKHHLFPVSREPQVVIDLAAQEIQHVRDLQSRGMSELDLGSLKLLESNYLREVWVSELNPHLLKDETEEAAIRVVESVAKPEFLNECQWTEVSNIFEAMKYLQLCPTETWIESFAELNVAMVKEVHRRIAHDVIPNGGEFRSVSVGASGTGIIYLPHDKIAIQLTALVEFVANELKSYRYLCIEVIELVSMFYSRFLRIHPFIDGNGRTARLLVNYLLRTFTVVPISTFLATSRESYLTVLIESQQQSSHIGLISLILSSIQRCVSDVKFLLMVDEAGKEVEDAKTSLSSSLSHVSKTDKLFYYWMFGLSLLCLVGGLTFRFSRRR